MSGFHFDEVTREWIRMEELGAGTYGTVYFAKNTATDKICAVKMPRQTSRAWAILEREIAIHSKLAHPNIVQYMDAFNIASRMSAILTPYFGTPQPNEQPTKCLLIEYAPGVSLATHLASGTISPETTQKWGREIIHAMIYLKGEKIIHMDIKPANILIHDNVAKLCDFGLARREYELLLINDGMVGTPYYQAPESFEHHTYSYQTDVWSFGVLMYQVLERRMPFNANSLGSLKTRVLKGERRSFDSKYASLEVLLHPDPDIRVKIEDCPHLEFFALPEEETIDATMIESDSENIPC